MSDADKNAAAATASPAEATVEIPLLDSVQAIQTLITEIEQSEPSDLNPSSRGYTIKYGFRAITPLRNLPIQTLIGMAGCINDAIASGVAVNEEGAEDGLNLVIKHAQNAVTVQRNESQFMKFLAMACQLGYGEDNGVPNGSDLGSFDLPARDVCETIVDSFMKSQTKVKQNSWGEWVKANA